MVFVSCYLPLAVATLSKKSMFTGAANSVTTAAAAAAPSSWYDVTKGDGWRHDGDNEQFS